MTSQSGPPLELVVPNIPVGPNQNGPFYLISNRNFWNLGLNGKHPLVSDLFVQGLGDLFYLCFTCCEPLAGLILMRTLIPSYQYFTL